MTVAEGQINLYSHSRYQQKAVCKSSRHASLYVAFFIERCLPTEAPKTCPSIWINLSNVALAAIPHGKRRNWTFSGQSGPFQSIVSQGWQSKSKAVTVLKGVDGGHIQRRANAPRFVPSQSSIRCFSCFFACIMIVQRVLTLNSSALFKTH